MRIKKTIFIMFSAGKTRQDKKQFKIGYSE